MNINGRPRTRLFQNRANICWYTVRCSWNLRKKPLSGPSVKVILTYICVFKKGYILLPHLNLLNWKLSNSAFFCIELRPSHPFSHELNTEGVRVPTLFKRPLNHACVWNLLLVSLHPGAFKIQWSESACSFDCVFFWNFIFRQVLWDPP